MSASALEITRNESDTDLEQDDRTASQTSGSVLKELILSLSASPNDEGVLLAKMLGFGTNYADFLCSSTSILKREVNGKVSGKDTEAPKILN